MAREFKRSFEEMETVIRDETKPLADRVLACFYLFSKLDEEEGLNIGSFTASDVADYMGISPVEVVEGAIVEARDKGYIAGGPRP